MVTTRRRSRRLAAVSALVGMATVAGATAAAASPTPVVAHRGYGSDRYVTASLLETPVRDVAYIVTGSSYADGVTAGALAGHVGANLFLTPRDQLTDEVRQVIGYYRKVVVVGGEASVGPDVVTWLRQNTRANLSRIAGVDRYETAAKLSASTGAVAPDVVFVATGENFADALSGSAAAAANDTGVLLVTKDSVPDSTRVELARLQPKQIVVLGGTGAVSDAVAGDLAQYATGTSTAKVDRIAGADRYLTAAQVSARYFSGGRETDTTKLSTSAVAFRASTDRWGEITSGDSWPDAIAAGAKAGRAGGPLLLSPKDCLPQEVNKEIENLGLDSIEAIGGDVTYSDEAAKRTSCGVSGLTYLDELTYPSGNAEYAKGHALLGDVFYPRSAAFVTYDPTRSSAELPNGEYRTWSLSGKYSSFSAVAGIADGTASGLTATIEVYGDERLLGTYQVAAGAAAAIELDVRGVQALKVVTTSSARTAGSSDEQARTVYLGDAGVR